MTFLLSDKCAQMIQNPTKANLSVKKKNCRLDRHVELLKITGSHLWAVRKAVEHLSYSLGGWLHVVDTFASSKMHTDKLNMCENVCAPCGKTPLLPLKRFPPPLKRYTMFWGPLSVEQLLQQQVVNKLLGLDAQKTVDMCCAALFALHQTEKGAAGNYKSGAITQQQIWQEQCCALFELQDSFTQCLFQWAWTMQAECVLCCRAWDCSSELGVNYKRGLCKLYVMAS